MKSIKTKSQLLRTIIQTVFFVWVVLVALVSTAVESGWNLPFPIESASLHAICPFGGVVTLWNLITEGTLIKKIHESAVVLAGLGVAVTVLFGPVLCGWICPFGTFQEWLGRIGKKIFKKRFNRFVPKKVDKIARYLRYVVLVWVVVMTALSASLIFQTYDPYYALFSFWREEVSIIGLVILGIIIVLSLFIERPFCKYACPYGALLGIFNKFRIFKIRRVASTCISCSKCTNACPMNIEVEATEVVKSAQCISCMKCTSEAACPVADTVVAKISPKKKSLAVKKIAIITLSVFIGGIILSMILGFWQTSSSKTPVLVKEGEFAGMPDPGDIRGSYTSLDIASAFSIPASDVVQAFGLANTGERVSTLEEIWGEVLPADTEIGTDSVRLFVSIYTGIPYEPEEGTRLPDTAITVLEKAGKSSDPRFALVKEQAIKVEGLEPAAAPTVAVTEPSTSLVSLTGKTTVKEALDGGVSLEAIEAILGPITDQSQTLKSIAEAKGMEFSEVKTALSE